VEPEEPSEPVAEAPPPAAEPRPAARPPRAGRPAEAVARPEANPDSSQAKGEAAASPESGTVQPPTEPAPLLRTPETADDDEVMRRVRETLGRADQNLTRVNYRGLSAAARAQHDTVKRFIAQSEGALRDRNLTFARFLADKAETLSASLLNR
jgi:hypothetical protein